MTVLLILIYTAFISLGLPDSILGTALPSILPESDLPLSAGSLLSAVIIGGTIVSSFLSFHVIRKLGTGLTVALSCVMTGGSLLGFSFAPSFSWLVVLGIPLGLGGGAVDTALNNFVALNYKAHHMNWLHSFWGVGATLGPLIMSAALAAGSWRSGYFAVSGIQLSLACLFLASLPLWSRAGRSGEGRGTGQEESGRAAHRDLWKMPGVFLAFAIMLLYCTVEAAIGLWGSSYLAGARRFPAEKAASLIAFYYGGIMAGRFLSGLLSFRLRNSQLIRGGLVIVFLGVLGLSFIRAPLLIGVCIIMAGFGLAPVFPSMLHETPNRFGKETSQVLIGYQMGFAYIGSAFLSPSIGVILQFTDIAFLPYILVLVVGILLLASEILTGKTARKGISHEDCQKR